MGKKTHTRELEKTAGSSADAPPAERQRRERLSRRKVIKAIEGTGGIVMRIAERLQCSRASVYNYLRQDPEVRQAYEDEKEAVLDLCENGLLQRIESQDYDAIKYYLGRKGKQRGYGDKVENPAQPDRVPVMQIVVAATPDPAGESPAGTAADTTIFGGG